MLDTYGDKITGDKIGGDKVLGNQNIYQLNQIDLDIGILTNLLQTNPVLIKESLAKLNTSANICIADESAIPISDKNLQNGLEDFYESFIKRIEQKLSILHTFFLEEDYIDDLEEASDSIKLFIYTYANRNSNILEPMIFNIIIQEHTKAIEGSKEKNIMKLVIYYLYRYCYIGAKDA